MQGVQFQRLIYCSRVEGYTCLVSTCGTLTQLLYLLCRKEIDLCQPLCLNSVLYKKLKQNPGVQVHPLHVPVGALVGQHCSRRRSLLRLNIFYTLFCACSSFLLVAYVSCLLQLQLKLFLTVNTRSTATE